MDQVDEAAAMMAEEVWKQLRLARYRVPAPETMDMYVDPGEGHDDFLMSIAPVTEVLASFTVPTESGDAMKPRVLEGGRMVLAKSPWRCCKLFKLSK